LHISAGIDVAKDVHWICAIDQDARVLIDWAFDNTQEAVDKLVADLRRLPSGELTIGLDVMGSFAAFLQAALLAEGFSLVHVPGIAVNRARIGFAGGETKSDPRDARVIAEQVRTRPGLRAIHPDEETTIGLRLLVGRRRDLVQDQTRRLSRLHQLLASIHPGLERALDLTAKAPLVLLARFVTPREIAAAGRGKIVRHLKRTPNLRQPQRLADIALAAAQAQRTVVPGEAAVAALVRELASEALAVRNRLAAIDKELEALVSRHPDGALIRSLPGMGAVLAAQFIATAGDISRFRSPDALAAAAGLAPVLRQSGRSSAMRRAFGGDKDLKRVLYMAAFCAAMGGDPLSRAFYDRKRREGKHHTQALIALARRQTTVLWCMLKHRTSFNPQQRKVA
jgi:transposase